MAGMSPFKCGAAAKAALIWAWGQRGSVKDDGRTRGGVQVLQRAGAKGLRSCHSVALESPLCGLCGVDDG
jgi:hypothetical protein